jgi:hypothetical protein
MYRRWVEAALLTGLAIATAGTLAAQQRQPPPGQPSIIMDEDGDTVPATQSPQSAKPPRGRVQTAAPALQSDPDLDAADQLAPSQLRQPMPAAVSEPSGGGRTRAATRGTETMTEPGVAAKPSRSANPQVVACSGVFGRDSSHVKLAMAFQSRNVAFTQVDAGSGGKAMASVLFAKDPKRRLEVWWSKPASRSDTHLIVINGGSDWTAPGELRLGLTLAELEQLNGKPFKLLGFDKNNVATLSNWNGGGLAAIPGGCKVGISLRPAPTAPASAISALSADREFTSGDAALRAVNPTVSEILVGY